MEEYIQQPLSQPIEKKSKAWIWILIIIILIAVGVGLYFWLSGGDTTPINNIGSNTGGSTPKPPLLP